MVEKAVGADRVALQTKNGSLVGMRSLGETN